MLKLSTISALCLVISLSLSGIAQLRPIKGVNDEQLPMPPAPRVPTQVDATALKVLSEYREAVGDDMWRDLTATGTIVYNRGTGTQTGKAKLYLMGASSYRLDTDLDGIKSSLRVGSKGTNSHHDSKTDHPIPIKEAELGLLAYPHLRISAMSESEVSLIDQGMTMTPSGSLHRITYQKPIEAIRTAKRNRGESLDTKDFVVMDLYFDPSSHLLIKSCFGLSPAGRSADELQVVVTYENYQRTGPSLFASSYSETVNGQKMWSLQLGTPNFSQGLTDLTFEKEGDR